MGLSERSNRTAALLAMRLARGFLPIKWIGRATKYGLMGLLLASPAAFLLGMRHHATEGACTLELGVQAREPCILELCCDMGQGFDGNDTTAVTLKTWGSYEPRTCSFPLKGGNCRGLSLRVSMLYGEGQVVLTSAAVFSAEHKGLAGFAPVAFRSLTEGVQTGSPNGVWLGINLPIDVRKATLTASFKDPLPLHPAEGRRFYFWTILSCWAAGCALAVGLSILGGIGRLVAAWRAVRAWSGRHPQTTVALVGLLAAVLSCYPVVFAGRSFVSPGQGATLLYPRNPSLPGSTSTRAEDGRGGDMGATGWYFRPISAVQGFAVLRDGEFPLWNRYDKTGAPLQGSGLSQAFDPLHWVTIVSGGAAWAWDLKYVAAKALFAIGVGLLVWTATRFLPSALILAGSAAFIGFFAYRLNHPAFFAVCYSPWILLAWLRILQASGGRERMAWLWALALATLMEVNSGAAKEAVVICLVLYLAGWLALVLDRRPWRRKIRLGVEMLLVCFAVGLITSPTYLPFLDALRKSATMYEKPAVLSMPPTDAIGFFEEICLATLTPDRHFGGPSTNLLVFLGVAWAVAGLRELWRQPVFRVAAISALVSFAVGFGIVPDAVLLRLPFLNSIHTLTNSFSCPLMILAFVLAGFGVAVFWKRAGLERWRTDYWMALALLAGAALLFFAAQGIPGKRPIIDDWIGGILIVLGVAAVLLPLLARRLLVAASWAGVAAIGLILCLLVLHARHGLHVESGTSSLDFYVANPQERPDFHAPSPAVQSLPPSAADPYRVVGITPTLFGGYSASLGIEGISGPDPLTSPYYRELTPALGFVPDMDWNVAVTPETAARLSPAMDLLNVRYLVAPPEMQVSAPNLKEHASLDLKVWERPTAWPRAFFVDRVVSYATVSDFARLLPLLGGRPFAAVQGAESNTGLVLSPVDQVFDRHAVEANDYELTSNRTSFTVVAPSAGIAVLTESYWPEDFQATVDGRPAPCLRVNHAFKGVRIDAPGRHRISFVYRPKAWRTSLWMMAGGLVLLLAMGAWEWLRKGQPADGRKPHG